MTTTEFRPAPGAAPRSQQREARALLTAGAVRRAAERVLQQAQSGRLDDWCVDLDRLPATADFTAEIIRARYPTLAVPVHSRWRHFVFEGRDLWAELAAEARWPTPEAQARAAFDLVILSVLLDAGAGAAWAFRDVGHSERLVGRSEGLALASLRWFAAGGLATRAAEPCRVDAAALRRVDEASLARALQSREDNPLAGLPGRAALLNRLGAALEARPDLFASADSPRPGGLFDALRARADRGRLPAATILETLLEALGPIWVDRPRLAGVPLGDCWPHPALEARSPEDRYVPLHKLSQWLSYSLIEPLGEAGITVTDVGALTGLAEYRNGGLFTDFGVLGARDPSALAALHAVADPFVVGWRALTVALLDRLAPLVGSRLGLGPDGLALARLLEGGTWAAGRVIARRKRADGGPPFNVVSDGTVF